MQKQLVLLVTLLSPQLFAESFRSPVDKPQPRMVGVYAERVAAEAQSAYRGILKRRQSKLVGKPVAAVIQHSREVGVLALDPPVAKYDVELQILEYVKTAEGPGYTRWNWVPRGRLNFSFTVSERLSAEWVGVEMVDFATALRVPDKISDECYRIANLIRENLGHPYARIIKSRRIEKDLYHVTFRHDGMDLTYKVKLEPVEGILLESTVP